MIKVLVIAAKLDIGGAEKVAADIGLYADKERYEIHYVVFEDEIGAYELELKAHGCKIFHIPQPVKSIHDYRKNLKQLIQVYHYDVIHAHTMFNCGWVMQVGKKCGVPVRVAHSHSALVKKKNLKTTIYEKTMRFMIRSNATDYVACGEKAGERLYGKRFFHRNGLLVLNGVDTQAFSYDESKRENVRKILGLKNKFVIGHVGHLASVKNQIFLIEKMPEILKERKDAYLLLLGDGEDRCMLEQKVREYRLKDYVHFTGNVRNVSDYLNAMDVFAFPSLYEGMPLSIIEVQSNGLPCVISNRVPEDVFLTDLIHPLPLEKPEKWVAAICAVKRKSPEQYAGVMMKSGFDVSTSMQKIYNIYEKGHHA